MKRFSTFIASLSTAALLMVGCYPDVLTPDRNMLPSASDFDVEIVVDQATNYVTFTMKNKEMVPMWIFGSEKIDGKASKKYAYTKNGLNLRIRDAGEHSVEVKAYNAHGISIGSKIVTFSLDNTYRDPFDPTPYMKAIAGEWGWNYTVNGHFGCGSSLANATDWWSCGANEKADWSLYNDRMTFTEDGKYMFDPGEDGKVYVNKDFTGLGNGPADADYLVDIPAYETTYSIENNWNDAGIEEIWLVLPSKTNLSYIPNNNIYDDPRFLFIESKPSQIRKELSLNTAFHGISWHYNFIHPVKVAGPEEFLAGTDAAGKVWVMDSAVQGHIGCGWDGDNAAGWWSCEPNGKDGWGMYDNELTFLPDGTFKFNSGADGQIYVNKEVTVFGVSDAPEDYVVNFANKECKYDFDGTTLTLAPENTIGYVSSEAVWNEPVFIVKEVTETKLVLVSFAKTVGNPDGIAWQYIFKARDVVAPEVPAEVVDWVAEDSADNLMNGGALALNNFWWADNGWNQVADPEITVEGNKAVITPTVESGGSQWQGQAHFRTGVAIEEGKAYDFKIVLNPSADLAGATVKPHPEGDDAHFFSEDRHDLAGYDDNVVTYENVVANFSTENLVITLDFPGCPAGTVIEVKGIIIQEHRVAAGGNGNYGDNLVTNVTLKETWFSPANWAGGLTPEIEISGNGFSLVVPEGTGGSEWQGQVKIFLNTTIESAASYKFSCTVETDNAISGMTLKLTDVQDKGEYDCFYVNDFSVPEYDSAVFSCEGLSPSENVAEALLILDFGRCTPGTNVKVSNIALMKAQ